jgi:hypothetical protein
VCGLAGYLGGRINYIWLWIEIVNEEEGRIKKEYLD